MNKKRISLIYLNIQMSGSKYSFCLQTQGFGGILQNGFGLLFRSLVCGWQCVDIWRPLIS
jgi:hypothetical protein